jgi:hypothetical protein
MVVENNGMIQNWRRHKLLSYIHEYSCTLYADYPYVWYGELYHKTTPVVPLGLPVPWYLCTYWYR